jgi:hypothetical protein
MFNVLNLSTGDFLKNDDGSVRAFISGDTASIVANAMSEQSGLKWQVRKMIERQVAESDWRTRERSRFSSGFYVSPVWFQSVNFIIPVDHFVHVSREDKILLAYTKNDEKGLADIQTKISVVGYLTQYCGIGEGDARFWQNVHFENYADTKLEFAESVEDIIAVYMRGAEESGISSCMTHDSDDYRSSVHPLTPYGDSDLSLAYLVRDEKVIARCMVWKENKIYSRLYGDGSKMADALKAAGFVDGSFEGAKIRRIDDADTGRLVLPYLDSVRRVKKLDLNWLLISSRGDVVADRTDGLESGFCCSGCGDETDEDDLRSVYFSASRSSQWCEHCRDGSATYCENHDIYVRNDNVMTVDGEATPDWCLDDANLCEWSGEYTTESVETVLMLQSWRGGREFVTQIWSQSAIDRHGFKCRIDGNFYADSCLVLDDWSDLPRSRFTYPNDVPVGFSGNIVWEDIRQMLLNMRA